MEKIEKIKRIPNICNQFFFHQELFEHKNFNEKKKDTSRKDTFQLLLNVEIEKLRNF